MSKSYVTLEQHVCRICGTTFDSGAILMDQRMRDKFEMHTTTGYGICPECQARMDEGYIALVGCVDEKSPKLANGNIKPEDAHRTGDLIHIRSSVWDDIFTGIEAPEGGVCFCDVKVIEYLKTISEGASDE